MNKTLRVGVSPWAYLRPECFPSSKTGCDAGVELDILEILASLAGMKVQLITTNVSGCGEILEKNGTTTWKGLFQMLRDGIIDMTGNFCTINRLGIMKQSAFTIGWPVWQYQEQHVIQAPKPPPTSFSPLSIFKPNVWAIYGFLLFLILILSFCILLRISPSHRKGALRCILSIIDPFFAKFEGYPLSYIWCPYLILLMTIIILYQTFIMSAVLHPYPIWKPFSKTEEVVDALSTCKYKVLAYRKPPAMSSCADKCADRYNDAVTRCGYVLMSGAAGNQLLSTIIEQGEADDFRLVMTNGAPYISLYLNDVHEDRDHLWIIDGDATFTWSSHLFQKNFTRSTEFNHYIKSLGDFKERILSRYIRVQGGEPHRSDYILEKPDLQVISLKRLKGVFFFYFSGVIIGTICFIVESVMDRVSAGHREAVVDDN